MSWGLVLSSSRYSATQQIFGSSSQQSPLHLTLVSHTTLGTVMGASSHGTPPARCVLSSVEAVNPVSAEPWYYHYHRHAAAIWRGQWLVEPMWLLPPSVDRAPPMAAECEQKLAVCHLFSILLPAIWREQWLVEPMWLLLPSVD